MPDVKRQIQTSDSKLSDKERRGETREGECVPATLQRLQRLRRIRAGLISGMGVYLDFAYIWACGIYLGWAMRRWCCFTHQPPYTTCSPKTPVDATATATATATDTARMASCPVGWDLGGIQGSACAGAWVACGDKGGGSVYLPASSVG